MELQRARHAQATMVTPSSFGAVSIEPSHEERTLGMFRLHGHPFCMWTDILAINQ
jgi:hypothetical protein